MAGFDVGIILTGPFHEALVHGFVRSLQLLALGLCIAVPIALVVASARLAPFAPVRAIGRAYVEAVRNIPLMAHLLFWYFGAPEIFPDSLKQWLYAGNTEMVSAVIALGTYIGAYMAEDIRSGVEAVSTVQMEAGRALGFTYAACMRRIILPQAVRLAGPPLISQALNLWKDTSIATVIGVTELMYQAGQVESATFRAAEPFTFATVAYLAVSLLIYGLATVAQRAFPLKVVQS